MISVCVVEEVVGQGLAKSKGQMIVRSGLCSVVQAREQGLDYSSLL
jgi:hypothetical protein